MDTATKVRENRMRETADRRGLKLVRSRTRDSRAIDYGLYALLDVQTGGAINPAIARVVAKPYNSQEVATYVREVSSRAGTSPSS